MWKTFDLHSKKSRWENAISLKDGLNLVQPINGETLIELLNKDAISGENVKFIHWLDFDKALQVDSELYEKVSSLGRKPDQRLKQHLQRHDLPGLKVLPRLNALPAELTNDVLDSFNNYKNIMENNHQIVDKEGNNIYYPTYRNLYNSESNSIV